MVARLSRLWSVAVPALLFAFLVDQVGRHLAPELDQAWAEAAWAEGIWAEAAIADGGRPAARIDRKSVVKGKSVSVRVDLGGRRNIKQKKRRNSNRNAASKKKSQICTTSATPQTQHKHQITQTVTKQP